MSSTEEEPRVKFPDVDPKEEEERTKRGWEHRKDLVRGIKYQQENVNKHRGTFTLLCWDDCEWCETVFCFFFFNNPTTTTKETKVLLFFSRVYVWWCFFCLVVGGGRGVIFFWLCTCLTKNNFSFFFSCAAASQNRSFSF